MLSLMVIIPFVILAVVWTQLPESVPIHWDAAGKADGYGAKSSLLWLAALPLFIVAVFFFIKKVDPKQKLQQMGKKIDALELILTGLMLAIAVFGIYSSVKQESSMPSLAIIFGVFFVLLGNYAQTIQPNYFLGVRTPWTLENDDVWKETHRFAGRLWMLGGGLLVIFSLVNLEWATSQFFLPLALILALAPVFYSYWVYRKVK